MKVVIEKEKLDAMYHNVCEKTERLADLIERYISIDELKCYMHGLLNEVKFCVLEAYNQELIELKLQLEYLRQELQSNKDVSVTGDLQHEYMEIKQKVFEIENPF